MSDLVWTDVAESDLRRIPRSAVARIRQAVTRIADERVGDLKKLRGVDDTWRLRVGEYRIIVELNGNIVTILRVLPRQSAYR